MSAVTPVTSMPANGVSPSGTLTNSSVKTRLQAAVSAGAADLTLIKQGESGDWFRVKGATLRLDYADADKRAGEIVVPNDVPSTLYHVLQERDGTASAYLSGVDSTTSVATLSATTLSVSGNGTVGGTLGVTGAATLSSTLAVNGASTLTGNVSAGGTLAVTGASTLTGLLTANGDILLGSGKVVGFGAPQALSGAGACNVTTIATLFTSTGVADALTLADGTRAGQLKFVAHVVDGGSGVLTPTTKTGFTSITFTNVNDWACLIWSGSAWFVLAYAGATIA